MALITVIVPVYNVKQYLPRCIDSILNQTFADFDLILVNDGSQDGSGLVCDEYAQKDTRIHVIHQESCGVSVARNVGIEWALEHSSSRYIAFIDSDDWILPVYLEALLSGINAYGAAISACRHQVSEGDALPDVREWAPALCQTADFYQSDILSATVVWCKLFEKKCFRDIRFPAGKIHEDEFITYKILFAEEHIALIDQPLYAYFRRKESITGKPWTFARLDRLDALEEQIAFFEKMDLHEIARRRYNSLLWNIDRSQQAILNGSYPKTNRRDALRNIQKRMRKVMHRYRKMGWLQQINGSRARRYRITALIGPKSTDMLYKSVRKSKAVRFVSKGVKKVLGRPSNPNN